jgi:hypothetical protein
MRPSEGVETMTKRETDQGRLQDEGRHPALRLALIEFATVFASELCWNFFRKTGGSTFDCLGIAAVTAILTYFVVRERGE